MNEEVEEDLEKLVGFGEVPVVGAVLEVDAERPAIVEPGPISGSSEYVEIRQLKKGKTQKKEDSYHRRPSTC